MKSDIQNAFYNIKADDSLITGTEEYLKKEMAKRSKKQLAFKMKIKFAALCACISVFCLSMGLFSLQYHTAETFVSIDVNPSVEITLNRFDKVISASSYNNEGELLLQNIDIQGKNPAEALEMLMTEMELGGYITQNGLVSVTVQTTDAQREQSLCRSLQITVENLLQRCTVQPSVEVFPVTQEIQTHAHGHNMTPAKYLAILGLMEIDETASIEQYSNSSIGQIRQRTMQCQQEYDGKNNHGFKNSEPDNNNNNGGNYRHGHGRENNGVSQ